MRCCGINAPELSKVTVDNVIAVRSKFLENVIHNGARSHMDMIHVLVWMIPIVKLKLEQE